MNNVKIASLTLAVGAAFLSMSAKADMITDAHGNVGYDTAAECDAAVANGTARFYKPFTHKAPLKRKGEARVQTASLKDLGEQYARGACDVGVGRRMGRDGVSRALQGKFIPFSPDMPVNVYTDKAGNAVRVTMAKCDNWFSGSAPRPVAVASAAARPEPKPEPVVVSEPVASVAPAVVPVAAAAFAAKPYVFGTVGALHAGVDAKYNGTALVNGLRAAINGYSNDKDTRAAGQIGFGVQFTPLVGAEIFYTGSDKHKFETVADTSNINNITANTVYPLKLSEQCYTTTTQQHTYGGRLTLGHNFTDKLRVFGKGGVVGTTMEITEVTGGERGNPNPIIQNTLDTIHSNVESRLENRKGTFARPTAGVGVTYNLSDKLAVRGDYDHYFKKDYKHNSQTYTAKGKNYVGLGIQYNFR